MAAPIWHLFQTGFDVTRPTVWSFTKFRTVTSVYAVDHFQVMFYHYDIVE